MVDLNLIRIRYIKKFKQKQIININTQIFHNNKIKMGVCTSFSLSVCMSIHLVWQNSWIVLHNYFWRCRESSINFLKNILTPAKQVALLNSVGNLYLNRKYGRL